MDIYPLTVMYYLFCKEALNWPIIDDKVSLRLENINACNELAEGMAHDAMVDVVATVELARRLKKHTKMWEYCCGYMQKNTDLNRLSQLNNHISMDGSQHSLAYAVNGKIGQAANFIAPVINLGQHNVYKNQSLWLRLDQKQFSQIEPDLLTESLFALKKKPAENLFILPYLDRYHSHIDSTRGQQAEENLAWLRDNTAALNRLKEYHQNYTYPSVDNIDADAALYDLPFASRQQQLVMEQFHRAAPQDKAQTLNALHHPVHRELGARILCKHFPSLCDDDTLEAFSTYQAQIYNAANLTPLNDYRGRNKLDSQLALNTIESLLTQEHRNTHDIELLNELKQYLQERITETV